MRLIIIRHGDPDYVNDSLTPRGRREAEALGRYLKDIPIDKAYVSPLGRAALTAELGLAHKDLVPEMKPWLREFSPLIDRPDSPGRKHIVWDWLPEDWTAEPLFFDKDHWCDVPVMREGHVREEYEWVRDGIDTLLEEHGYRRNGLIYESVRPNHDTVALFCHLGVSYVILSHLLNVSPMVLWHGFSTAPTSIISVYTEERRPGKISFRVNSFGAVPHLEREGIEPSKRARYVECFGDDETGFEKSFK